MFDTLQDRLSSVFKGLRAKGRLTEADIDATMREIRIALLEADVNLGVVKEFVAAVKGRAMEAELSKALNPSQQVIKFVHEELISILGGEARAVRFAKQPPTVIMLAGLQGAGKTTLAGKLARWLKAEKHAPLLVAADLQRPNAVNQLQIVGERAGVHVIVDTAGRLGIDEELMQQAADIKAAVRPHETLFVVDAMIGQDAVNTAKAFDEGVGVDGVVLTKLDGDARGGAALSIARVLGKPIMFASSGEALGDFDRFHPDRMASRILGMGDVLTLIEQAEKTFDAEQSRAAAEKLMGRGKFGLQDFLSQMQQLRKMGPMSKILGMLPGAGQFKQAINEIDEKEIDRIEAIIYSMTPAERDDVSVLNGSRRARIAKGAGVQVSEVNKLVTRFVEARKMMEAVAGGGMPGMPGMPGMGGRRAPQKKQPKKQQRKGPKGVRSQPSARPAAPAPQSLDEFQLPPELQKMFDANKPKF